MSKICAFINSENLPEKEIIRGYKVIQNEDTRQSLTLVAFVEEWHPHPDSPEYAWLQVLVQRTILANVIKNDPKYAGLYLFYQAQNNVAFLLDQKLNFLTNLTK